MTLPECIKCGTDVTEMEDKGVRMSVDAKGKWQCTDCHPDTGVSRVFSSLNYEDYRCGYCDGRQVLLPGKNWIVGIDRDGVKRCLLCHATMVTMSTG